MPLYKQHGTFSFEAKKKKKKNLLLPQHSRLFQTGNETQISFFFWMSLYLHCLQQRQMGTCRWIPSGGRTESISHHSLQGDLHRMDTLVFWFPGRRTEFGWKQSLEFSNVRERGKASVC